MFNCDSQFLNKMIRDRLDELKKRMSEQEEIHRSADSIKQMEDNQMATIFRLAEEIGKNIEIIHGNVRKCNSLMKQILESPFMEKELSNKITEIFEESGKITQTITSKLKQFQDIVRNKKTGTAGRIETIQYNTLRTRFKECLKKNNDQMEVFKNHRINTYKKQLRVKGVEVSEEEFSEFLNGHQQQIFNDNHLIETVEARRLLCEVEELNEQLLKIEGLITEIRDLFVQMSVLVEEQQDLIDVVEYQTQKTADYVIKITNTLEKAEKSKRKSIKMKIICYGIIAIVIIFIVISFVLNH